MSTVYFFELLGHVHLAAHTAHTDEDVAQDLKIAGFSGDRVREGVAFAQEAEDLFERKLQDTPDNKTQDHNTHSAATEVEMWLQTVKLKLRKSDFSRATCEAFLGHDVHAHKHLVTVIAQAYRALGMLRTMDAEETEDLGGARVIHDMVMRGNTLTRRLCKTAEYYMAPSSISPAHLPIHAEIDQLTSHMVSWLGDLDTAAAKLDDALDHLGLIGHLPHGLGLPVGGAGLDILTHKRAKHSAPNHADVTATSGWSVGRQGNRENLGSGWITPTYEG